MKKELIVRGTDLPICPRCKNGNAMLDLHKWNAELEAIEYWFDCRDCGYKVDAEFAEIVVTSLDKPGMGYLSTYTEVARYNGLDWLTGRS